MSTSCSGCSMGWRLWKNENGVWLHSSSDGTRGMICYDRDVRHLESGRLASLPRRLRWWWLTRACECHWQAPYGEVVMAGCPAHD